MQHGAWGDMTKLDHVKSLKFELNRIQQKRQNVWLNDDTDLLSEWPHLYVFKHFRHPINETQRRIFLGTSTGHVSIPGPQTAQQDRLAFQIGCYLELDSQGVLDEP